MSYKSNELYFEVLDYLFPNNEDRKDDYYIQQLASLLYDVYNTKKIKRVIARNLKESVTDDYIEAFREILKTKKSLLINYMNNRLSEDREKANLKRYIENEQGEVVLETPKATRDILLSNTGAIYQEIIEKTNYYGKCYVTNSELADKFKITKVAVSNIITKLKKYGYIDVILKKDKTGIKRAIILKKGALTPIKDNFNTKKVFQ